MLCVKFVPKKAPCYALNFHLKGPPMFSVKFSQKKAPHVKVKFVPEKASCYALNFYLKRPPMLSANFLPKKAPMLCIKFSPKRPTPVKR